MQIFSTSIATIKDIPHESSIVSAKYSSEQEEIECQKFKNATRNPVLNIPLPKQLIKSARDKREEGNYGKRNCILRWAFGWFWLGPCFDPWVRHLTKQDYIRTLRFLLALEKGYDPRRIPPVETAALVLRIHPEYLYFAYSHGAIILERRLIN